MKGTIIRLLPNKGYGFIRGSDGISRFMHANQVVPVEQFDLLREGTAVEFTPDDTGFKGNRHRALKVRILK